MHGPMNVKRKLLLSTLKLGTVKIFGVKAYSMHLHVPLYPETRFISGCCNIKICNSSVKHNQILFEPDYTFQSKSTIYGPRLQNLLK
jgi:hypothetical protein